MAFQHATVKMSGELGAVTIYDPNSAHATIRNSNYFQASVKSALGREDLNTYESLVDFIGRVSPDPAADGVVVFPIGNNGGGNPGRLTRNASTRIISYHAAA